MQGVVAEGCGDQPAAVPGIWMRVERLGIPASVEPLELDQGCYPGGVEQGLRGVSDTGQGPQGSSLGRYGSTGRFLLKAFQQDGFGLLESPPFRRGQGHV